jgi:hypothetical protein
MFVNAEFDAAGEGGEEEEEGWEVLKTSDNYSCCEASRG